MKPIFSITIAGEVVSEQFADRVTSITVTDSAEQEGDVCEIALDDRDIRVEPPPDLAPVEISLGYEGQQLVSQGIFMVDEVEVSNGPRSLVIKASATPSGAPGGEGFAPGDIASGPAKPLLDFIYAREGGYNSYNNGNAGDGGEWPGGLTRLTIGQVMDLQNGGQVKAVGAAQFTPSTLPTAMRDAGLSRNDQFSAANQDKMATALMLGTSRPALREYLLGRSNDITAAQQALCQEWAGVVCPSGRGFFDGDSAGNRGSGSVAETQAAMKAARASIMANRSAGQEAQAAAAGTPTAANPTGGAAGGTAPRSLIKGKHTESYHDTTLGEIAGIIAKRHNLKLNIEAGGDTKIEHEDQTNESDQNFLTKLADRYGLVIKPAEGALHLLPRGERALAGNYELEEFEVSKWRARVKERATFGKVRARYIDREDSREKVVEVGDEEDGESHEAQELFRNEEEATVAAQAELQGLNSGYVEVNISMPGRPDLAAQGTIVLSKFHPLIDNQPWLIKRVTQTFSGSGGFSSDITCGTPGDEPTRGDGATAPVTGGQSDMDSVAFANGTTPVISYPQTSGMGDGRNHQGHDYAMPVGRLLSARQSGKVLLVSEGPRYGKFMDVQLADGRIARLAHLQRTWIPPGKTFSPGQVLAQSGNTGRSTGPHLHFEDRTTGSPRNPSALVQQFTADP